MTAQTNCYEYSFLANVSCFQTNLVTTCYASYSDVAGVYGANEKASYFLGTLDPTLSACIWDLIIRQSRISPE